MAEPKYYEDDKAILDMMYQMVYGGQPTTSIERSYGGMKDIPKPPPPPDDSIIDEYMARKKLLDEAQARASIGGITLGADVLGGSMARMSKIDDLSRFLPGPGARDLIAERGIPKNMSKADMKDYLNDQFIYEIMEQEARKPKVSPGVVKVPTPRKNMEFPYRQQEKLAKRYDEIFPQNRGSLSERVAEEFEPDIYKYHQFPHSAMDEIIESVKKPIPRDQTKHFTDFTDPQAKPPSSSSMDALGYIPFVGGVYEATTGMGDAYKVSNEMKELYKQMTPEQQAKVKEKLREQSMDKLDSAIDSYSGDF